MLLRVWCLVLLAGAGIALLGPPVSFHRDWPTPEDLYAPVLGSWVASNDADDVTLSISLEGGPGFVLSIGEKPLRGELPFSGRRWHLVDAGGLEIGYLFKRDVEGERVLGLFLETEQRYVDLVPAGMRTDR